MFFQSFNRDFFLPSAQEQPTDTISSISWAKSGMLPTFVTGSWDSYIRIYQITLQGESLVQTASFNADSPCLCVDWHEDEKQVFAGCSSRVIKGFDLEKAGEGFEIGSHTEPVKDVYWLKATNTLCSISFDKTVRFWDLRQSGHVGEIKLDFKPFCSDFYGNKLAIGLSEEKVTLVDVVEAQRMQGSREGLPYRESPLGKDDAIRSIKFFGYGSGLAFGSVQGRCNISRLETTGLEKMKLKNIFTFKAQVENLDRSDYRKKVFAYPVNCLLTNTKRENGFLGTCGGEGMINFWDYDARNKICYFHGTNPVTCAKMNLNGDLLAYATGNDWSRGYSGRDFKHSEMKVRVIKEEKLTWTPKK